MNVWGTHGLAMRKPLVIIILGVLPFIFYHVDIDECMNDTWPCHANATCHNNIGSFTCTCKDGFMMNGTNCDGQYYISTIFSS